MSANGAPGYRKNPDHQTCLPISADTVERSREMVDAVYRAESRRVFATLIMIEATNLDEALQMAAKIPPACVGNIEVRPVQPIREMVRAGSQPWLDKTQRSG